jgi:hypothetical protein
MLSVLKEPSEDDTANAVVDVTGSYKSSTNVPSSNAPEIVGVSLLFRLSSRSLIGKRYDARHLIARPRSGALRAAFRGLRRGVGARQTSPMEPLKKRPGDVLLDRYLPDADEVTRELAREAFRDFACFLLRMGERLEQDEREAADSTKPEPGATISEAPSEPRP